jgi:hypothetical protein
MQRFWSTHPSIDGFAPFGQRRADKLCEINVSSVFPIPESAYEAIARAVESRLRSRGR